MAPTSKLSRALYEVLRKHVSANAWSRGIDIPVAPVPASRPRVSKWGTYYAPVYKTWMLAAEKWLTANECADPQPGVFAVHIEHICTKPKTTKLSTPRGDYDNYDKGLLDVLTKTGVLWKDDTQIALAVTSKRFSEEGELPKSRITAFLLEA
jgi:Holliday junction resolvase RusA-like endonuclease